MATRSSVARRWLARYDAGVPPEVEVPAGTLDGLARAAAGATPDGVALDFLGARTTFAELDDAIDRFARALTGLGLRGGQRVSLHLPTCPAFVIALLGTVRAGAIAVPMNPLYTERELTELMAQTTPAFSVALDLVHPRVAAARAAVGGEARGAGGLRRDPPDAAGPDPLALPAEGAPRGALEAAGGHGGDPRPAGPAGADARGAGRRGRPARGSRDPAADRRHHRRAEVRDPQPSQPAGQLRPDRGVAGRRAAAGRRDALRPPLLPHLRADRGDELLPDGRR